jgi:hypothetical protein
MNGQLHAAASLPPGKSSKCPLNLATGIKILSWYICHSFQIRAKMAQTLEYCFYGHDKAQRSNNITSTWHSLSEFRSCCSAWIQTQPYCFCFVCFRRNLNYLRNILRKDYFLFCIRDTSARIQKAYVSIKRNKTILSTDFNFNKTDHSDDKTN